MPGRWSSPPLPAHRLDRAVHDLDAERHLVAAGGVDLVGLPVRLLERAGAVALARVVEDHLLVQLVKVVHAHLPK